MRDSREEKKPVEPPQTTENQREHVDGRDHVREELGRRRGLKEPNLREPTQNQRENGW